MNALLTGKPLSAADRKAHERAHSSVIYTIIKGRYYHGWVGQVIRLIRRSSRWHGQQLLAEFGPYMSRSIRRMAAASIKP